jgi:hypothetical protein
MLEQIYKIKKIQPRFLCPDRCETKNCKRIVRYVLIPTVFINSKPNYKLCKKCFDRFENEFESNDEDDFDYYKLISKEL